MKPITLSKSISFSGTASEIKTAKFTQSENDASTEKHRLGKPYGSNEELRICIDLKSFHTVFKRSHFPIPTSDGLFARFVKV